MASRVQAFINCASQKASFFVSKTVYCGKVAGELTKTVYFKEGLQPPNISDFEMVYWRLLKQFKNAAAHPQQTLASVKSLGKNDLVKYGAVGVQMLGLYSLGEAIGRRHLVGYTNYSSHH
ncbi:ADL025Wp [Eremothecium gossypii ATCC 10895]|uniref:ADL025Wp n=1 Tax=Eremothecium gossypii (strain ATCC 10895 / CBS 109.51 / FGSC 9923 / NRRL Y-1056) TaxID=284811 RepID=Q75AE2_EREGS|nr:ADL025Wp [Eremothecium gossypii ATCC 10895]AAS51896.1 ADL025Wp [Eremothecium gossypii ATCC 10895]AEY96195.1 FADL025Wp [Eremothecium gossypii FDAG1]